MSPFFVLAQDRGVIPPDPKDPPEGSQYVAEIGVDPDLVQEGLIDALTPYLIVAIALGFGFFAVKLGVRWLKSNARG